MSITAIVQNDIIRLPVGLHLPDGTAVRLEIAQAGEPATRWPAGYFERTAGALAGEPMEVLVNDKLIARGEAVVVNEKFGVRLTDIISPSERIEHLK